MSDLFKIFQSSWFLVSIFSKHVKLTYFDARSKIKKYSFFFWGGGHPNRHVHKTNGILIKWCYNFATQITIENRVFRRPIEETSPLFLYFIDTNTKCVIGNIYFNWFLWTATTRLAYFYFDPGTNNPPLVNKLQFRYPILNRFL